MSDDPKMKHIDSSQVEVLDETGRVIKQADHSSTDARDFKEGYHKNPFQLKVVKMGPLGFLLIPLLIPIMLLGFFFFLVMALLFGRAIGKGVFKVFSFKGFRS